jgi:FkbM family methyltransferase
VPINPTDIAGKNVFSLPMLPLFRKVRTFIRVLRYEGLRKSFELASLKVNSCLGRVVEKRGNVVKMDGCAFSVDSPSIPVLIKGYFFFNRYEHPERKAVQKFLDPKLPVVELGGAIGVVACITNKMLVNPRNHVVVEPNPALLSLLQRNRDNNACAFSILPHAVDYNRTVTTFYRSDNYLGSSLDNKYGEPIHVEAVTVGQIVDKFGFETCSLICDIEGGEYELVAQESHVLQQRVKTLILEVHDWVLGSLAVDEMLTALNRIGFRRVYHKKYNYVFENSGL